jgi:hypothetical protein
MPSTWNNSTNTIGSVMTVGCLTENGDKMLIGTANGTVFEYHADNSKMEITLGKTIIE